MARVRPRPGRVGRPGAERRGADGRRTRTGPHAVPFRAVARPRRHVHRGNRRGAPVRRRARRARRSPRSPKAATSIPRPVSSPKAATSCCSTATRPTRSPTALRDVPFRVASVDSDPFTERPRAPFTTSTLQQESGRKLRFTRGPHDGGRAAALRAGLHHLHADRQHEPVGAGDHRGAHRDPRAVRRRLPAGRAARVPQQGEERAGSARSDPARRRRDPHARRGARRARRRRATPLRADLDAHDRVPDGRRARPQGDHPPRRDVDRRRARDVPRRGQDLRLPRLAARVRRRRRRGRRGRARSAAAVGRRRRRGRRAPSSRRSATRRSRRRATPKRAS